MNRVYEFRNASVFADFALPFVVTRFEDGSECPAAPEDTDAYRETARRLGYNADVAAMSREHEVCHSLLAEWLGFRWSWTLWATANPTRGAIVPREFRWAEEEIVMQMQGWLNRPGVALPEPWQFRRRQALALLRGWCV